MWHPGPFGRAAPAPRLVAWLPRGTALAVLAMGGLVLFGWALGIRVLQSFLPGYVTMKPNTALGLATGAGALLLLHGAPRPGAALRTWAGRALAMFVLALGAATLAQYAFAADLGIDRLVVRVATDGSQTATPGRMAAVTALEFVLLGCTLLTLDWETRHGGRPSQLLAAVTGAIALTAFLGYVYGVIPRVGPGHGIQIAMHTAVGFVLLAVGALADRPDAGWMRTLVSDRAGGLLARRLLPVAFFVPLGLGALRALGTWAGFYGVATGSALVAVGTMIGFGVVIWRTALVLDRADRQWQAAERERLQSQVREESALARADAESAARADAERARAELATEREFLRGVLESLTDGIVACDARGVLTVFNRATRDVHGLPEAPLPPERWAEHYDLFRADGVTRLATEEVPLYRALKGEVVRDAEVVAASKDGERRVLLSSGRPMFRDDGEPLGAVVAMHDITERRKAEAALGQAEAQLRQSQKLEAVGQLAGGVAHDFNNMLTAIKSYAQLVADAAELSDSSREDVREIVKAADRAAALTRQLLAFSRQQMLQPKVLELNAVVGGVEPMLRRLLLADVRLATALAPDLGRVLADPGQVEQVLLNLAVNARDAMPGGGTLTIAAANVELDAGAPGGHAPVAIPPGRYVMLAVTDTGCGMDAATQERIFEPFFTTKEKGKGTGLGLSTVYGIVKQSGGYIWVYSEPGHGTTFKLYLPRVDDALDDAREAARVADQAAPAGRGTETILLVEDEDSVRAVAQRVLERQGYMVLAAANGAEALEVCDALRAGADGVRTGALALVITDMVMPEMSGRELAARIRERHPGVRLLFMSGYTKDAARRQSFLAADDAFLEKPFTIDALARAVRDALDRPEPGGVSAGAAHLPSPLTGGAAPARPGPRSR